MAKILLTSCGFYTDPIKDQFLQLKIVQFFTPQMNTLDIKDFSALNVTDKLIFPHYDREDMFKEDTGKTIEERLKEFEYHEQCEITRLNDDQTMLIIK